jgi:hypothetical protein
MPKTPRKIPSRRRKTPRRGGVESGEYAQATVDAHQLVPVIVNPASKFVVATYWWGRGRQNPNTQWPCPEMYVERAKEQLESEIGEEDPDYAAFIENEFIPLRNAVTGRNNTPVDKSDETKQKWNEAKVKRNMVLKSFFEKQSVKDAIRKYVEQYKKEPLAPEGTSPEYGGLMEQPMIFETMIGKWEEACKAANCNYLSVEYPEFTINWPKFYQSAINAKPMFIKKALESCGGRGILYVDGDMLVHKYPKIFDLQNVDIMAHGWGSDPRTNIRFKTWQCYDPYIFETSGGTMFYANTPAAIRTLDDWNTENNKKINEGKAEDRVLSMMFTMTNKILDTNLIQLPIEYLWLTDKYSNFVWDGAADINDCIIEHPACLTAEEAASEQGASANRLPKNYVEEISRRVNCNKPLGTFYEYIFFPNKDSVDSLGPYLNYMKSDTHQKLINIVPYEERYGIYNEIVDRNRGLAIKLRVPLGASPVVLPFTATIPVILNHLIQGKDVWIGKQLKTTSETIEAVAFNKGSRIKTEYLSTIVLDVTKPMFFSSRSHIVFALLSMCEKLSDINIHMTNSYMFLSRIRWQLLRPDPNSPLPIIEQSIVPKLSPAPLNEDEKLEEANKKLEKEIQDRLTKSKGVIPKKVNQIWFGGEIPPWRQYLFDSNKTVAERNGYTYRLWKNEDRTPENFESTIAYQNDALKKGQEIGQSRWAQVADLARLEIIYKEGGIYIDSLFETSDDFYNEISKASEEGVLFIGCNEDPCELECKGGNGKKYLSNSFFAASTMSDVLARILDDNVLAEIDLEDQNINQTTGPYFLRTAIVNPVEDRVKMLKTEEIYPFPMSGSTRPAEPNPYLLRAPLPNDASIQVNSTMWLQKNALEDLRTKGRPIQPLALYHVGLGGTWST